MTFIDTLCYSKDHKQLIQKADAIMTSSKLIPNINTEIATVRIIDLPIHNRPVLNLLRSNASLTIAEKVYMALVDPRVLKPAAKIAEMKLDVKNSLTTAISLSEVFLLTMIWVDNTYDPSANQMRRAYEKIRDGVHCMKDQLKNEFGIVQATMEFKAGVINYLMAIGYTDYMMIESQILEFNAIYEGSKLKSNG